MSEQATRSTSRSVIGLLLILLTLPGKKAIASDEIQLETLDGEEISLTRFPADGEYLALWLAPEYGFREAHRALAAQLAAQGIEVWQGDLVEELFMTPGTASLKQFDGSHVAELIDHAHRQTGKQVIVVGDSYAAMIALRGARKWQQVSGSSGALVGAVLFTPYSYAYIPPLGLSPPYLPIVEATSIPLMIYQAQNSATYSEFDTLLDKLRRHDSPVYTRLLPGVMSLFYEDPPTEAMRTTATAVARNLARVLPLLAQHDYPAQAIALAPADQAENGIDIYLREFRGNARPPPIRLRDVGGRPFDRSDFSGKVSLVNFWATWCPPCIEEIPSLNRLRRKFAGRPFELISINYAQDRDTVLEFLQRVPVEFPVLLDAEGDYAKSWNVISFPSTFVIDKSGRIRYGVNAAIDWDSPELLDKLETLLR
jgi:thiol-disulfide isomerase/thioredoxin